MSKKNLERPADPLLDFRFQVEIDGLFFGGFTEVSGLSVEIQKETYREGGVNDAVHELPTYVKYQDIVLKQGILDSDQMWKWIRDVRDGKIEKRNGRIILLDANREPMWYWNFIEAFPVKWSASDLKATSSDIFVETLVLSHRGIEKNK